MNINDFFLTLLIILAVEGVIKVWLLWQRGWSISLSIWRDNGDDEMNFITHGRWHCACPFDYIHYAQSMVRCDRCGMTAPEKPEKPEKPRWIQIGLLKNREDEK